VSRNHPEPQIEKTAEAAARWRNISRRVSPVGATSWLPMDSAHHGFCRPFCISSFVCHAPTQAEQEPRGTAFHRPNRVQGCPIHFVRSSGFLWRRGLLHPFNISANLCRDGSQIHQHQPCFLSTGNNQRYLNCWANCSRHNRSERRTRYDNCFGNWLLWDPALFLDRGAHSRRTYCLVGNLGIGVERNCLAAWCYHTHPVSFDGCFRYPQRHVLGWFGGRCVDWESYSWNTCCPQLIWCSMVASSGVCWPLDGCGDGTGDLSSDLCRQKEA
jgi:hypothetical protein